jgi:hypothetical protein
MARVFSSSRKATLVNERGHSPGGDAAFEALPGSIAKQSLSTGLLILPFDAALAAIDHMARAGRRLENWEGWVRLRDGGRTKSLSHGGSFALSPDAARAAESAKAGITRARDRWLRDPEYPGAELYYGLTFGAPGAT